MSTLFNFPFRDSWWSWRKKTDIDIEQATETGSDNTASIEGLQGSVGDIEDDIERIDGNIDEVEERITDVENRGYYKKYQLEPDTFYTLNELELSAEFLPIIELFEFNIGGKIVHFKRYGTDETIGSFYEFTSEDIITFTTPSTTLTISKNADNKWGISFVDSEDNESYTVYMKISTSLICEFTLSADSTFTGNGVTNMAAMWAFKCGFMPTIIVTDSTTQRIYHGVISYGSGRPPLFSFGILMSQINNSDVTLGVDANGFLTMSFVTT